MRRFLICLALSAALRPATHAQFGEQPAARFMRLMNQYKQDSLRLLLTDDFSWNELFVRHTWTRQGFLDTFLVQSKAIHGTFRVLNTYTFTKDTIVMQAQDQSDYITYLKPRGRLVWNIKIISQGDKISRAFSDTTRGNRLFMDDLVKKHTAFTNWLNKKYPGEDEEKLYRDQTILDRLKEFAATKKN